jgi:hypothetical protein
MTANAKAAMLVETYCNCFSESTLNQPSNREGKIPLSDRELKQAATTGTAAAVIAALLFLVLAAG